MKKIALAALIVSSLLSSTFSFANSIANNYASSLHPKANIAANLMLHPPTDITIINASTNYIYAVIPNFVNDLITPGNNDHLYGYQEGVWSTYIMLQDPNHNTFFSTNVCRLAIVTVYGGPGSYRITTDSDLCL